VGQIGMKKSMGKQPEIFLFVKDKVWIEFQFIEQFFIPPGSY
jgi:hypothetical protein